MNVAEIENSYTCNRCDIQLPLRESGNGEKKEWWNCSSCGATHRAVFDENSRAAIRDNVSSSEAAKEPFGIVDGNGQIVFEGTKKDAEDWLDYQENNGRGTFRVILS